MPRSTINGTAIDLDGKEMILDADQDTTITADTDDQIDIRIAGADDFAFKANTFEVQTGSNIDMNGTELILDADADTSITADTDDRVDIKVAGSDKVHVTSTGLGVGTNSPTVSLDVTASGNNFILVKDSSSGSGIYLKAASDGAAEMQTAGGNNTLGFRANGLERMHIDANGHITMPYQSAFSSKISSNQTNIPVYTETKINFDTEIFDQNADYNNSTYIFTAPVTGRYQLQAHLFMQQVNKEYAYAYMLIKTSNRNHAIETDPGVFDEDAAFSMTLAQLCDMDANDTAFVTIQFPNYGSAQADIHTYSEFSGYLVC